MKKILIILFTVATSYGITNAQKPGVVISDAKGWHKIGSLHADFQKETDEISVLLADKFAALKLKIEDAPINIKSMKVFYEDGTIEDVTANLPFSIQPPGESKVIDLKGTERELKKVQFTYSTVNNMKDKKAEVELWGLKTNADEKNKAKTKTSESYRK